MDLSLVASGAGLLVLSTVLAFLGTTYRPVTTPLMRAPAGFSTLARSSGIIGALAVAYGATGFGGGLVVAVTIVAVMAARAEGRTTG